MTIRKTYYPIAGQVNVTDANIAYSQLFMVARTGVVHVYTNDPNELNSGDPYYQYIPATGTIIFNLSNPFQPNESINIVYE